MRSTCLLLLALSSLVPLGCGGDEPADDGETADANDQSTGASSSTGGGTPSDNECGADGYQAATEIAFGGDLGTTYSPRCVTISVGGAVTWTGDFGIHPIVGGAIEDGQKLPDPGSPITGATGMELVVTFDQAGTYPFYCDPHGTFGMNGAVQVE